jgi:hypothetical protein
MMAARNPHRRVSPATTWLIRAFAPGCPTMLRSWASQKLTAKQGGGERLTIYFDLPNDDALALAGDLAARAPTLRLVRIGKTTINDLAVLVSAEQRTLKIEALLGSDDWGRE